MKKILKSMMFLIIGIVSIFATNVHAETYNGGFGDGDVIETKVYVNKMEPNGFTRWQRVHTLIQYSTGHSGNYSTDYQLNGRELLTPDEVRLLDNKYAILFIRGEKPIMDYKYDVLKHQNVELSGDRKAKPYLHGEITKSIASVNIDLTNVRRITQEKEVNKKEQRIIDGYEIISSEEIDNYFNKEEVDKNEDNK